MVGISFLIVVSPDGDACCSGATPRRRLDGPGGCSCRCGEQGSPLGAGRRPSSARSPTTSRVLWQRATPRRRCDVLFSSCYLLVLEIVEHHPMCQIEPKGGGERK